MLVLHSFLLPHATCCIKKIICVSCCDASASSSSLVKRPAPEVDQNSSGSLRFPSVDKKNAIKKKNEQIPRKPHETLNSTVSTCGKWRLVPPRCPGEWIRPLGFVSTQKPQHAPKMQVLRIKIDWKHIIEQTFDHNSAFFEIHLQLRPDKHLFRTNVVVTILVVNI